MRLQPCIVCSLVLLLGASTPPVLPATIKGRVTSIGTEEALPGVNVIVQGTTLGAATDANGEFRLPGVKPGIYDLTFSCVGYKTETQAHVAVQEGGEVELKVRLEPAPVQGEPIVVTASKREQSLQDVPVSVSTFDAASIARRNIVTLDEALRFVPGVNLTDWQVNIRGSSGYSRGAGSRVLLLVDGIPFTTGDTGELNFETIPANQVDRVEVVKGAGSALYGSSALGGVINVITKRIPSRAETGVRVYGGFYSTPSYSQWDWGGGTRVLDGQSFSHSQTFDNVGMLIFGSRAADDGYRQNDYRRRYNGYLKVNGRLSDADDLTATIDIMHQKRGSFLFWKDIDSALVPPDGEQGNFVESNRFFLSGLYTHAASSTLLMTAKAMWFHNRFDDAIDTSSHVSRSDVLRGEVQLTWYPVSSHIATFGIEGTTDRVSANLFGQRSGYGVAAYAQDEMEIFPELKATFGARLDFENLDSLETMSQFNPKLGVVYTPAEGTTLRASLGWGFRAPAVAEAFVSTSISGFPIVPNPRLKAERSTSYEIGGNQLLGNAAVVDVAVFRSDFDNLIESGFTAQGQGQFNNVTRARVEGMETSVRLGLPDGRLLIDIGYTYVWPRDLTENDLLKYRPRHLLYANLQMQAGMFTAGMDFRYISRVERIDQEFVALGIIRDGDQRVATNVTDLRFGLDFSGLDVPLIVRFNIDNVFQYNYVELIGNMAPPRPMVLSLETKL